MDALLIILFLHVTLQVVFGCGDGLCATTLTANGGFVRAAIHQVCEEGREEGREGGRGETSKGRLEGRKEGKRKGKSRSEDRTKCTMRVLIIIVFENSSKFNLF